MVAKRGIMFEFDTALAPGAAKALEAIEKRVDALQKRMHLTLSVTERGGRSGAGNGSSGGGRNGQTAIDAAAKAAERAMQLRERAAERAMRTEARWSRMAEAAVAKRERDEARAADKTEREAKRAAEAQIRELRRVERERQRAVQEAAREDARGWKILSAIGRESYVGNRKVAAGFEALSDIGRDAMPRDAFAEGLRKMEEAKAMRTGWSGLGAAGADAQQRLKNLRDIAKKDDEERKRALDSQKGQLREINSAAYDVVHAFGQLTRAAAQFGLVGQRDMMKVLDTIFAVEGGINALQGGMNAFRAIRSIREARAGMGPAAGAAKYAAGLARLGGTVAGTGATGTAAAGAGGIGLGTIGLAVAGVTALAAGGIGLLGTIADRRRGVPGQVGGFWDTVGTKLSSNSSRVTGYGLRAFGGLEAAFNSPYGLTSRERELRTEGVLERTANSGLGSLLFGATGQHALSEMRIGRQERFTSEEIERRGAMRERKETEGSIRAPLEARLRAAEYGLEAQRYGFGAAARGEMGRLLQSSQGESFSRQQAAHAELLSIQQRRAMGEFASPAQEARAKWEESHERVLTAGFRGRREKILESQQRDNRTRGEILAERLREKERAYQSLSPDYTSVAGATGGGGRREIESAYQEMLTVSEEVKKNDQERVQLASEIKKLSIEGAREQLQLHEQDAAAAKQTARSLRERKQSDRERFGAMLPEQRMAVRGAMEAAVSGHANRHQIEALDQFDFARETVRGYRERAADAAGFEEVYGMGPRGRQIEAAERKEKIEVELTIKDRGAVQVKLEEESTERAREAANVVIELMKQVLQHERQEIEEMIREGVDRVRREQNQDGRGLAIG